MYNDGKQNTHFGEKQISGGKNILSFVENRSAHVH